MGFKTFISSLVLIPSLAFAGLSCEMSKLLQNASQSGKLGDRFWQDYARASQNGIGDRELSTLMQKHGVSIPKSESTGRRASDILPSPRVRPQINKTVYKDIDRLPPVLKQKYAEVVENLTKDPSGASFYKTPGKWHFEKLPRYGNHAHSVRLDSGYRVLFDIRNGVATIRQVDKTVGH